MPIAITPEKLVEKFVVQFGYCGAPEHMAAELLELQRRLMIAERHQSAGYMRRAPEHHTRQPKPALLDPVTDDWIHTGREVANG